MTNDKGAKMRTNEAGLKIYELGDEVQVGNGKVRYTVVNTDAQDHGVVVLKSHNTGNELLRSVENLRLLAHASGRVAETVSEVLEPKIEDEETHLNSAYGRSILFALNLKEHIFAGVGSKSYREKRRAKNKAQKAGHRANRK
jgi:hypothetical protein